MKRRLTDRQLAAYVAALDVVRATGAFPRAKALTEKLQCTDQNVLELFERLCERGWIDRIGKGAYVLARDEVAA